VRRVGLGVGGEPPHVREHDGEFLLLTPQLDAGGELGDLLDDRGGHHALEHMFEVAAMPHLGAELVDREQCVGERQGHQGIDQVDDEEGVVEQQAGRDDQQDQEQDEPKRGLDGRDARHDQPHEQGEDQDEKIGDGVRRRPKESPGHGVLEDAGVDLDPGERLVERRGTQVEQPVDGGPDQHHLPLQLIAAHLAREDVAGRVIGESLTLVAAIIDEGIHVFQRGDTVLPDLDEPLPHPDRFLRAQRVTGHLKSHVREQHVPIPDDGGVIAEHTVEIREITDVTRVQDVGLQGGDRHHQGGRHLEPIEGKPLLE